MGFKIPCHTFNLSHLSHPPSIPLKMRRLGQDFVVVHYLEPCNLNSFGDKTLIKHPYGQHVNIRFFMDLHHSTITPSSNFDKLQASKNLLITELANQIHIRKYHKCNFPNMAIKEWLWFRNVATH